MFKQAHPHTSQRHTLAEALSELLSRVCSMASPPPSGTHSPSPQTLRQRLLRERLLRELKGKNRYYVAFVWLVFISGVLLMALPAELLTFEAPERPALNLNTTFSSLSSQGWLSLVFILFGFLLMVFDLVGYVGHLL